MINGIYAATLSVLDKNLALNIEKTIKYAENLIEKRLPWSSFFWKYWTITTHISFGKNSINQFVTKK